jgi:hypothetical protein
MGRFEDYGCTGMETQCFRQEQMARISCASQNTSRVVDLKNKKNLLYDILC